MIKKGQKEYHFIQNNLFVLFLDLNSLKKEGVFFINKKN